MAQRRGALTLWTWIVLLFGMAPGPTQLEAGEQPWADTDPSAWTLEEAEAVLWNSPWAKVKTVPFFGRDGNRWEARFCVRLQSALPIRIALAQSYQLQPEDFVYRPAKLDHQKTEELATRISLPGEIVLSVIIFPPSFHRRLNEQDSAEIRKTTHLFINKESVPLKAFIPPKDSSFGEAWFRFPRPDLKQGEKIRFVTELHTPRKMKVEVEFETNDLLFEGKLEY